MNIHPLHLSKNLYKRWVLHCYVDLPKDIYKHYMIWIGSTGGFFQQM